MTDGEFFEAVRMMRVAQIKYFRTRDVSVLSTARACEAAVDLEIAARTSHPDLFDVNSTPGTAPTTAAPIPPAVCSSHCRGCAGVCAGHTKGGIK